MIIMNYQGTELKLFRDAINWKRYLFSSIYPMTVGSDVLEVGAGLGGTTAILETGDEKSWVCLEPDPGLLTAINNAITISSKNKVQVLCGTIDDIPEGSSYDTILYVDVLEHIFDDTAEIQKAAQLLRKGGKLVIIAPAMQWLFSEFDKNIGHFRRYDKKSLLSLTPECLKVNKIRYLDSIGLIASLGNVLFLRQNEPSHKQIQFWDRYFVKLSMYFDPILRYSIGKSILCVWEKIN